MTESPRRPPMSELSRTGYSSYTSPDNRLSKRLGASLPNLEQPASDTMAAISSNRPASLRKMTPDIGQCQWRDEEWIYKQLSKKVNQISNFLFFLQGLKSPHRAVKVFRLPEFPPPLAYHYVQNYYSDMVASLGKAINSTPPDESALLARYCEEMSEKTTNKRK